GQHYVSSGAEEIPSQLLFRLHHLVDFLLHRAEADELMDKHVLGLPDAEGAVGRLVFHSRVPPPIEVDDVRSCGEIESRPAGLDGEHEERDALVLLKPRTRSLRLLIPVSPCRTRPRRPNTEPRNAASGAVVSLNCVKMSAFSCRAPSTSTISRRRMNLPLSSSAHGPSPSHCEGWLQICFSRIRNERTMPLRLMPLTSSSWSARSSTACW